jgi:uncharacterized protein with HEPN domain
MQRDEATVLDMAYAARLIQEFTNGMDQRAFLADRKTQSAVLHQIMVLGEATKRLSAGFRAAHTQVPWSQIARMRDRVIHHYDTVDLHRVWAVIETDIPAILALLDPLVPGDPGQSSSEPE